MSLHRSAQRPAPDEYPPSEAGYIARVPDGDVIAILDTQVDETLALLRHVPEEVADVGYAPGKWTVKEAVGHMADTERIMAYRALCIARGDTTPLPGYDQDAYVPPGEFNRRSLANLLAELAAVRRATVALFAGLTPQAWTRMGTANDHAHSVRAFAYTIAGHELHHQELFRERYGLGGRGPVRSQPGAS
jgi:hypothetical protein